MAFYRNRVTGKVQHHPVSGLGETFNAEEIAEDGKPIKPRTSLAPSADELKAAKALLKDQSGATPLEVAAAEAVVASAPKSTGASGSGKQEGAR